MKCPKCNKEFEATTNKGYTKKFCSRSCANSRKFSDEVKRRRSISNREYYKNETSEAKQKRIKNLSESMLAKSEKKIQTADFDSLGDGLRRKRILREQDKKCNICGIIQIWNDKPLTFHLDHIDGNRSNNTRENLRMICPNCHTQTETYCQSGKIADDDIIKEIQNGLNTHKICLKLGMNPSKIAYEKIKKIRNKLL